MLDLRDLLQFGQDMADRGLTALEPVGGSRMRTEFHHGGEYLQLGKRHLKPSYRCMYTVHDRWKRHELY